ncbi:serine/arginine repetitive matrix protein 2-like isoform X1 [Macrobrachium nipponense]|uniref:serine/arginine repetitive matrix protein 2-like isoform X1 n=1 Tax=Macrobrachium nipponense TaxID=159736 RepID=UPI0030C7E3E7
MSVKGIGASGGGGWNTVDGNGWHSGKEKSADKTRQRHGSATEDDTGMWRKWSPTKESPSRGWGRGRRRTVSFADIPSSATNGGWPKAYYSYPEHGVGCKFRRVPNPLPWYLQCDVTEPGPIFFGVLPGLYVGNFRDSKDPEQLKTHNITHILSIHDNARKLPCNSDKEYMCVVASDSPGQNLTQYFPACNDFIHTARLKGGGVLIHCLAGMSRSVTVAVVYVMCVTSLSWRDSLKAVRGARNVANPNVGFLKQLQDFENERLGEERRRLRAKYHNVTLEDEDEQMAKQLLASYYHSMSIGEMCEGNCPPGVACPRGLCHPPRRVGLFRRNSRDSTGSRSSSPSRHRSSSPSRGSNSPGSSPVSPRRSSPTPPSPLIRRPSHSRSSSPQLSPPQSMSPSSHRRSSSPLTSPRHGSAPTSPNHNVSPVRSMSSSPLNSPVYGSPLPSPKNTFIPTFGTRHSYTSPPGTPTRSTSPVGSSRRSSSPCSSPKKVSSAPNSPQHSGSSYSPKNIFRKCSLWNHSKNNSQSKSSKSNSDHHDVDNYTDSLKNKKEEHSKQPVKQEITKQTSLPLQPTQRLSPNQQIYRQNSLPQQHSQSQLTPQYQPSSYGSYLHIYRQSSLPEEEPEESLQIYVSPFSSPQNQRYRWVTCHVPTNNQHSQESELPPCPYNELFKQASMQEPRHETSAKQNNVNNSNSKVDNINSVNDSDEKEKKIMRQSSLDHYIKTKKEPTKPLTRQTSLPEGSLNANTNSPQRRPPPPPIPEYAKVGCRKHSLDRQNSFSGKGTNNNAEIPPVLHVPILPRVPPPLPPNKPQYMPNSSKSAQSKTLSNEEHLESNTKNNLKSESPAKTHQTAVPKDEQKPDMQARIDKRNEAEMNKSNSNESPVKKLAIANQNSPAKEYSLSQSPITVQQVKSDTSTRQDKSEFSKQCSSSVGSPTKKQTKPESPKKQSRHHDSPSKSEKIPESPIKHEKKLESPLVHRTPPGSPIKRQVRSDSPLKQEGRPESPLKHESPVGSPTRRQKKPEPQVKQDKRPESPIKKEYSGSATKKRNSTEASVKPDKKPEPVLKKEKQPDSPLSKEPICTCGGKVNQTSKGQVSIVKQASKSSLLQNQLNVAASAQTTTCSQNSQSLPNTTVLPQTKDSQSSSQKPPCPPRKAVPSSVNSSDGSKETTNKSGQVVLTKELQNKSSIHSQQQLSKRIIEAKLPSCQRDSKPPSPAKEQVSKTVIAAKQQTTAVKSQSTSSKVIDSKDQLNLQNQSEHTMKSNQEKEQHHHQTQQHQVHHSKEEKTTSTQKPNNKQEPLPDHKKVSENSSIVSHFAQSKPCSSICETKESGPLPVISKHVLHNPHVLPNQSSVFTPPKQPVPIQQQPRPTPPLPPSPKPTVAMLSQSQNPRSCTPCLPIQPCPNPAVAAQASGSAKVVIAVAAVQQPSTTVPPTGTTNSHPPPVPKQRPSSHSSTVSPNIPSVKANSSADSGHSRESVVAPTSASTTLCPTVQSNTPKCQSGKSIDNNDSSKVKQAHKINTDKQKTTGNPKPSEKDAPLTPHKPNPAQTKPPETGFKSPGKEVFKTSTLKDSPMTCCSPLPPLPNSPKPSVNSKQGLNSPKITKAPLAQ